MLCLVSCRNYRLFEGLVFEARAEVDDDGEEEYFG
jgi:hypothetical protein